MNARPALVHPAPSLPQALALPMQELMAKILGEARQRPLRQIMLLGATAQVGTSLIARHAAAQLVSAFGRVLVVEVTSGAADDFSALASADGPVSVMRMSTAMCLSLFGTQPRVGADPAQGGAGASSGVPPMEGFERFGLIVWDVPAPTQEPVALVMSGSVDGIVLLVQAHKTRRHVAAHVVQRLQDSGGRLIGVVLNRTHNFIPGWIYRLL